MAASHNKCNNMTNKMPLSLETNLHKTHNVVYYTEEPCKVITPLKDVDTVEDDSVTLILEISKPRQVTWFKGGAAVSERFKVGVDDKGVRHTLTVDKVLMEDNAEFTAQIDDLRYGMVTSKCHVTVKGQ